MGLGIYFSEIDDLAWLITKTTAFNNALKEKGLDDKEIQSHILSSDDFVGEIFYHYNKVVSEWK